METKLAVGYCDIQPKPFYDIGVPWPTSPAPFHSFCDEKKSFCWSSTVFLPSFRRARGASCSTRGLSYVQLLLVGHKGWFCVLQLEVNQREQMAFSSPKEALSCVLYVRETKHEGRGRKEDNDHLYNVRTAPNFFSRLRICTSNEYQPRIMLSHAEG